MDFYQTVGEEFVPLCHVCVQLILQYDCSYLDIGTQKLLPDFGVLVIYRG